MLINQAMTKISTDHLTRRRRRRALIPIGLVAILLAVTLLAALDRQTAMAEPAAEVFCVYVPAVFHTDKQGLGMSGADPVDCGAPGDNGLVDFNGDGYGDLAIGSPGESISGASTAGAVTVLYGTVSGLKTDNIQLWTQAMLGNESEAFDRFGNAVTARDFDGDGYTDLAVGSSGEDGYAGQVNIIYGSAAGLLADGVQTFSQDTAGIEGVAETNDQFGFSLTSGDYNGDGYGDLAVGAYQEDNNSPFIDAMGAVNVIYGSAAGLTADNNLIIHQYLTDVEGTPTAGASFGWTLETGDFDGDDFDDLAVGIPGYDLPGVNAAGAVEVFFGSKLGITLNGEQLWHQDSDSIQGVAENDDWFGAALAAGDFDKNGTDDLAIGVPREDVTVGPTTYQQAGAIHILYGFQVSDGLSGAGDQIWYQGIEGIINAPEDDDWFGWALVSADFDGDGDDDLAVGAPRESLAAMEQGLVHVFYSNGSILSTSFQDFWTQGIVEGAPEEDRFGNSLGAGDFNGDGHADLAVGVQYEDVGSNVNAGAVNVIYGKSSGLNVDGNQIWHEDQPGVPGVAETNDQFGDALTR
jgi:hypothetical protein